MMNKTIDLYDDDNEPCEWDIWDEELDDFTVDEDIFGGYDY